MRVDPSSITGLRAGLERLADAIGDVTFHMAGDFRDEGEVERDDLVRTIREYLLPRLRDPDAPVVACVVGPAGTGKSTLINSMAGEGVTTAGPLRPTTTAPVMWAHREHAGRAWSEFVARVRERVGPALEVVVGDAEMTRNLTIIDTPPFDLATSGGSAARHVLSLVDLCVFVTTGLRYADAASWKFLEDVKSRGLPVLFVLNRLGDAEGDDLLSDFAGRLAAAGMMTEPDPSLVFGLPEVPPGGSGRLPVEAISDIRRELADLSDPEFRHSLVYQTAEGAARSVAHRSLALERAVHAELASAKRLAGAVDRAYGRQADLLTSSVGGGDLAWLVEHDHWPSVAVDLTGIVTRRAGVAAQESAAEWADDEVGSRFLHQGGQGLWRHSHDTTYESQRLLETWAEGLEDLAVERSGRRLGRRKRRRIADYLWKAVLDRSLAVPGVVKRVFGSGAEGLLAAAVDGLGATLERALRGDAARFLAYLGGSRDPVPLERVVAEAGAVLSLLDGSNGAGSDPSRLASDEAAFEPAADAQPDEADPGMTLTTGFTPAAGDVPPVATPGEPLAGATEEVPDHG